MKKEDLSLSEFEELAHKTGGNLSAMAQALGVTRQAIYYWLKADTAWDDVIKQARESFVDFAESQLVQLVKGIPRYKTLRNKRTGELRRVQVGWIDRPDTTAVIFTLKTRGRERGYVERQEIALPEKINISLNLGSVGNV